MKRFLKIPLCVSGQPLHFLSLFIFETIKLRFKLFNRETERQREREREIERDSESVKEKGSYIVCKRE